MIRAVEGKHEPEVNERLDPKLCPRCRKFNWLDFHHAFCKFCGYYMLKR